MSRSRIWLTLIGLGTSALAVLALLRSIDVGDAARRLERADPAWFAAACAVTVAGYLVRAARWGELLEPHGRPPLRRLFSATMVGFLAINTLPARLGEFVRAYVLARGERISAATVLGSVAVERLLDLAALGAFWSLSLLFAPYPGWFRLSGVLTFGLAAALGAGLWLMSRARGWKALGEGGVALAWLPSRPRRAIGAAIPAFGEGLRAIGDPGILARSSFWTALMWLVNGAVFLLVGRSLGLDLPIWSPFLLAFVVCVGILVPSSPGFVGVLEGACVVGLGLIGVPGGEALAYGLLYHACQLLPLVLLGTWYALRQHVGTEVLRDPAEPGAPTGRKDRRQ